LIIAGASARAAAASALRAGFAPWCADLFADADLARGCPVRRISGGEYPHGLPRILAEAPPGPWLYTGALENHPRVVEGVARPLLGNPAAVLRRVRDPRLVHAVLSRHGVRCPEIAGNAPDERRRWLVKPKRSAGGAQIRVWSQGMAWYARHGYVQERIDGDSYAAVYVGCTGGAGLVGVTRQLVGEPWLHAAPFHYCGSVGPVELPASASAALDRMGNALATEFGLRGLFGVDFILNDDEPWPVEVNPRYTASVEVIERATGRRLIAEHAGAFGGPGNFANLPPRAPAIHGKAILFAPAMTAFPARGPWDAALNAALSDVNVAFADLPRAGAVIDSGAPVLTAFAREDSVAECIEELRRLATGLYRLFDAAVK
jgi:predicted ATP-grasp superfamily ATP-dependent carboligase